MCSSSSHHGYLEAAICWPPANLVIILPVEPSSPQGREDKEVPMSSCPAPVCMTYIVCHVYQLLGWQWNDTGPVGARVVVVGGGGDRQEKPQPTKCRKTKPVKLIFSFTLHPYIHLAMNLSSNNPSLWMSSVQWERPKLKLGVWCHCPLQEKDWLPFSPWCRCSTSQHIKPADVCYVRYAFIVKKLPQNP